MSRDTWSKELLHITNPGGERRFFSVKATNEDFDLIHGRVSHKEREDDKIPPH